MTIVNCNENDRKLSKREENAEGKGEIARFETRKNAWLKKKISFYSEVGKGDF